MIYPNPLPEHNKYDHTTKKTKQPTNPKDKVLLNKYFDLETEIFTNYLSKHTNTEDMVE